jgi:hypothetical protein
MAPNAPSAMSSIGERLLPIPGNLSVKLYLDEVEIPLAMLLHQTGLCT